MNRLSRFTLTAVLAFAGTHAFAQDAEPLSPEEEAMLAEEARLDAEEGLPDAPRLDPTAPNPAPAFPELRPVLEQFGGEAGLTALMETFMDGLLADPRTGPFFAEADQARVKRQLVAQFCVILGGDCVYSGRDMRTAHAGQAIDRAHFNALVEVLQVAMDRHGIPFRAQNQLLAKLAPMHREVVND